MLDFWSPGRGGHDPHARDPQRHEKSTTSSSTSRARCLRHRPRHGDALHLAQRLRGCHPLLLQHGRRGRPRPCARRHVDRDVPRLHRRISLAARQQLVQSEIDYLAFAARYITYEQVLRFLMDYIDGDKYYKIQICGAQPRAHPCPVQTPAKHGGTVSGHVRDRAGNGRQIQINKKGKRWKIRKITGSIPKTGLQSTRHSLGRLPARRLLQLAGRLPLRPGSQLPDVPYGRLADAALRRRRRTTRRRSSRRTTARCGPTRARSSSWPWATRRATTTSRPPVSDGCSSDSDTHTPMPCTLRRR